MRCKNCGWPNKPGETTCVKCNSPLDEDFGTVKRTALEVSADGVYRGINSTIPEQSIFGDSTSENNAICPRCGYPLRFHASKCPNCNYDVSHLLISERESEHQVTRMENPNNTGKIKGTINPYMMQEASDPTFVLKPVERIGEKKPLSDLEYEGTEVALTRSNTEPDNGSITSQTQAEVVFQNGKWFIVDKSEFGTTFVRATKKIELEDGDTILLGNRLFEFHTSND